MDSKKDDLTVIAIDRGAAFHHYYSTIRTPEWS